MVKSCAVSLTITIKKVERRFFWSTFIKHFVYKDHPDIVTARLDLKFWFKMIFNLIWKKKSTVAEH